MKRRSFLALLSLMPLLAKAYRPQQLSGTFTAMAPPDLASVKHELTSYFVYWLPNGRLYITINPEPGQGLPPVMSVPEEAWLKFNSGQRIPDGPNRWRVEV